MRIYILFGRTVRQAERYGKAFSTREMKSIMAWRPEYTGILPFLVKAVSLFNLYVCFINFFPGPFPIMNCVKKKSLPKICLNLKKTYFKESILLFLGDLFD